MESESMSDKNNNKKEKLSVKSYKKKFGIFSTDHDYVSDQDIP